MISVSVHKAYTIQILLSINHNYLELGLLHTDKQTANKKFFFLFLHTLKNRAQDSIPIIPQRDGQNEILSPLFQEDK